MLRSSLITVTIVAALALTGCPNPIEINPNPFNTEPRREFTPEEKATIERALQHIEQQGWRAGLTDVDTFEATRVVFRGNGRAHVHFERLHEALPVLGGDLLVRLDNDADFSGFSVRSAAAISVPLSPSIDRADAISTALDAVEGVPVAPPTSRLTINTGLEEGPEAVLAHEVLVRTRNSDGTPSIEHVAVNATTGKVVRQWNDVKSHAARGRADTMYLGLLNDFVTTGSDVVGPPVYTLDHPELPFYVEDVNGQVDQDVFGNDGRYLGTIYAEGELVQDFDNFWGNGRQDDLVSRAGRQTAATDVYFGIEQTYRFFEDTYGRRGWRDDGLEENIYGRVHYGQGLDNAFYNPDCDCLTFGNGRTYFTPMVSLDVVGHEWSHGLTQYTADLYYFGESGGLNEATSDIFGTMVEHFVDHPSDPPDYKIGEKVIRPDNGYYVGQLRSMDKPSTDGISADCWSAHAWWLDVHWNSGIANRWFYLVSEGSANAPAPDPAQCGDAPAADVAPSGMSTAGDIWYRALTTYMTANTNYAGARMATLKAAQDAVNEGSANPVILENVAHAWSTVNVRTRFLAGDANANGQLDFSDALTIVGASDGGTGVTAPCMQAADFDGDGDVDVDDARALLHFLFLGQDPPAYVGDPEVCVTERPAHPLNLSCDYYPAEVDVCSTSDMGALTGDVTREQLDELAASGSDAAALVDELCAAGNGIAACN